MPFPSDSFNLRNPGQSGGGIFYVNRSRRRQQPSVQPQSQPSFQEAVGETANPVPPQDFDGTPTVDNRMPEVGFGYVRKMPQSRFRQMLPDPESLAISGVGAAIGAGALGFGAHASQAPSMGRLAGHFAGLNATAPTHGAVGSAAAGGFSKAGALQDAGGMFTGNSEELSSLIPPSEISLSQRGRGVGVSKLGIPGARFMARFNPFQEESPEMIGEVPFGFEQVDLLGVGPDQMNQIGGNQYRPKFSVPGYGMAGSSLGTGGVDPIHTLQVYGSRDKFKGSPTGLLDAHGLSSILDRAMRSLYSIDPSQRHLAGQAGNAFNAQGRITGGPSTLEELLSGMGQNLRGEQYTPSMSYGNEIR